MQYVFPALILVMAVLFVASTLSLSGVLKHLRLQHHPRWLAMGRPSAIRSTPKATGAIFRFLTRRQWSEIPDPELARRGLRTLRLSQLALAAFGMSVLWVLGLSLTGIPMS